MSTVAEYELTEAQASHVAARTIAAHLAVAIAKVDGEPDDRELKAALQVMTDLGYEGASMQAMREDARTRPFSRPLAESLLRSHAPMATLDPARPSWIVGRLAVVAAADGAITPEEMSVLRLVAEHTGVGPAELAEIANDAQSGELSADSMRRESERAKGALGIAVMIVGTAIAAADGVLLDAEIDRVWQFFDEAGAGEGIKTDDLRMLAKRVVDGSFDPATELAAIADPLTEANKDMLLQFGMRVALIDGPAKPVEREMLQLLAATMGINEPRLAAVLGLDWW